MAGQVTVSNKVVTRASFMVLPRCHVLALTGPQNVPLVKVYCPFLWRDNTLHKSLVVYSKILLGS